MKDVSSNKSFEEIIVINFLIFLCRVFRNMLGPTSMVNRGYKSNKKSSYKHVLYLTLLLELRPFLYTNNMQHIYLCIENIRNMAILGSKA